MNTIFMHHAAALCQTKAMNLGTGGDTLKMILMAPGFSLNRATMKVYADVSSYELPTANGYTGGGAAISGQAIAEDDTVFRSKFTFNSVTVTASGGSLSAMAAIVIDTTISGSPMVMYIDFNGTLTALSGQPIIVPSPEVDGNC